MYIPDAFAESRTEVLESFISENSLAAVVTMTPQGIIANHIPLLFTQTEDKAILSGHVSRANSVWRDYDPASEVLAIFTGPQRYISPNWYPTKAEHGRVVPTWNYMVVHAYGKMRTFEDPSSLRAFLTRLTDTHEAAASPLPWKVSDAPDNYVEGLLKAIVGIEIDVTRLEGKWKLSQNRPAQDREAVARHLAEIGDETALRMLGPLSEADKHAT
jgi:transcriptional regulator